MPFRCRLFHFAYIISLFAYGSIAHLRRSNVYRIPSLLSQRIYPQSQKVSILCVWSTACICSTNLLGVFFGTHLISPVDCFTEISFIYFRKSRQLARHSTENLDEESTFREPRGAHRFIFKVGEFFPIRDRSVKAASITEGERRPRHNGGMFSGITC